MADDYKIQLSVKAGQDMLNVRANTADELQGIVDDAKTRVDLKRFFEGGTFPYQEGRGIDFRGAQQKANVSIQDVTEEKPPSDIEALANIEKHLGKPASAAQIAVAAKKSGKPIEELAGISEADAKALIAGGQ